MSGTFYNLNTKYNWLLALFNSLPSAGDIMTLSTNQIVTGLKIFNLLPQSSVVPLVNNDLTNVALVANNSALFESIKLASTFSMNSEETITSDYIFVRVRNTDFNYTTNPSMISGSGEFVYSSLINNPQTFITTVGLYNDATELLSVAKLSKPLVKDFTKEALVRVKLDF